MKSTTFRTVGKYKYLKTNNLLPENFRVVWKNKFILLHLCVKVKAEVQKWCRCVQGGAESQWEAVDGASWELVARSEEGTEEGG